MTSYSNKKLFSKDINIVGNLLFANLQLFAVVSLVLIKKKKVYKLLRYCQCAKSFKILLISSVV